MPDPRTLTVTVEGGECTVDTGDTTHTVDQIRIIWPGIGEQILTGATPTEA